MNFQFDSIYFMILSKLEILLNKFELEIIESKVNSDIVEITLQDYLN